MQMSIFNKNPALSGNIYNQFTEISLCREGFIEGAIFVQSHMHNVYTKLAEGTIANIEGMPIIVFDSLVSNKAILTPYKGLIELIVMAIISNSKNYYSVEVVQTGDKQDITYRDVSEHEIERMNQSESSNILVIDGNNHQNLILEEAYYLIYEYMLFCHQALTLANKPVIKFNELRVKTTKPDLLSKGGLSEQIKKAISCLKTRRGGIVLDGKDTIELTTPKVSEYEDIKRGAYEQICSSLNVPLSFITGYIPGTLSTTGDGDATILQNTFERNYYTFLKPILDRVIQILELKNVNMIYSNPNNLVAKEVTEETETETETDTDTQSQQGEDNG